jgi:hypothetical protein
MKYGIIVASPNVMPYVIDIEAGSATATMDVLGKRDDIDFLSPLMVVDYDNDRVMRIRQKESGIEVDDTAYDLLGALTDVSTQEIAE